MSYVSEYAIRVRYADTDQMGFVYYGNYASFFEIGRVEALRALGMSYKSLEDQGVMMPVLDLHCQYLAPARYDELLTLQTIIRELPSVKIKFEYQLFNESKKLIHTGATTLVFLRKDTMRPCRCPMPLIEVLKPYFHE